jgi:hypothetical protein
MWTMPVPSSSVTSSQATTRCSTSEPGSSVSNGPSYRQPTSSTPVSVCANVSSGYRATATHSPFERRPYSASGFTAAATFAGSVHGVVVQITSDSPLRSSSGSRT